MGKPRKPAEAAAAMHRAGRPVPCVHSAQTETLAATLSPGESSPNCAASGAYFLVHVVAVAKARGGNGKR